MTHQSVAALSCLVFAPLILACGGSRQSQQSTAAPIPSAPFSFLASQPVMVFPVQYLRTGETLAWSAGITRPREFLASFDSVLTATFGTRGLTAPTWAFPSDVIRMAQRNPTVASNPRSLSAEVLRGGRIRAGDQIEDPLASQIRMAIALHEARMVILPIEIRFESAGAKGRALLRTVVLDARASQVQFIGDVASDSASAFSPDVMSSLARNLASMVVPP